MTTLLGDQKHCPFWKLLCLRTDTVSPISHLLTGSTIFFNLPLLLRRFTRLELVSSDHSGCQQPAAASPNVLNIWKDSISFNKMRTSLVVFILRCHYGGSVLASSSVATLIEVAGVCIIAETHLVDSSTKYPYPASGRPHHADQRRPTIGQTEVSSSCARQLENIILCLQQERAQFSKARPSLQNRWLSGRCSRVCVPDRTSRRIILLSRLALQTPVHN